MKTLSSVLFVLTATAASAFADSAYFLPTTTSSTRTVVSTVAATSPRPNSDRISVIFRPMTRAAAAKLPMVFVDRRYTRGSAQAAIVR